jgi:hypothetical protein
MEQEPDVCKVKENSLLRYLRKYSDYLLIVFIFVIYPYLPKLIYKYMYWVSEDPNVATAWSTWMPLGNPLSKVVICLFVMALAYAGIWLGMKKAQPGLADWAKNCFTTKFLELDPKWQFAIFALFWLVPLLVFGLIWVGASLLA